MEVGYDGVLPSTLICVHLFGPLEVSRRAADGSWQLVKKDEWSLGTPPRSVFRRLLTTSGRRLSRSDIEDDLWPEIGIELADRNLSNALMVVRRVVGKDLVETTGPLCGLAAQAQIWTDFDACFALLKKAENHGCFTQEALPFLEEALGYFERGKCLEDEGGKWCHAVRADAERMQRQCRMWLAQAYEMAGKLWQAGEQYRAMMRSEPPDEEALACWIQMLVRHGKIQEALKCYQDTRTIVEARGFPLGFSLEEALGPQAVQSPRKLHTSFASSLPLPTARMIDMQSITDLLDQAEHRSNQAWEAWFTCRPDQASREVIRLLPTLEKMLSQPFAQIHLLRMKELAARCHALLATIYMDALQNDAALYHSIQAYTLAEELHDLNLMATYLALQGDVLRRQNDKATAIGYMEQARNIAVQADRSTLGHVLQLLAYTHADSGHEAAFEWAAAEAMDLLAFTGEGRDATRKEFIPFELHEIQGKANRDLGRPLKAIPYLELAEQSLSRVEAVTPRWHALLAISRGQAFCDAGDITTGVDLAISGFLGAYQCRSPRQMNRVRKLLRKLEGGPWKDEQKIGELRDIVHELYLRIDIEK